MSRAAAPPPPPSPHQGRGPPPSPPEGGWGLFRRMFTGELVAATQFISTQTVRHSQMIHRAAVDPFRKATKILSYRPTGLGRWPARGQAPSGAHVEHRSRPSRL